VIAKPLAILEAMTSRIGSARHVDTLSGLSHEFFNSGRH